MQYDKDPFSETVEENSTDNVFIFHNDSQNESICASVPSFFYVLGSINITVRSKASIPIVFASFANAFSAPPPL